MLLQKRTASYRILPAVFRSIHRLLPAYSEQQFLQHRISDLLSHMTC